MPWPITRASLALLLPLAVLALAACHQVAASDRPAAVTWTAPAYATDAFNQQWRDGKAELATYDLVYPRYGHPRQGTAVAVVVTEPFRWSPRVKADTSDNSFGVIKLNLSEDFPTGVYDYNVMTSAFVATEPVQGLAAGSVVKQSFSSQEWCGQVWEQAVFHADRVDTQIRSYFENAADQDRAMTGNAAPLSEDALFLWARGLAGPALEPGESVELPLFRSAAVTRLRHVPPAWDSAVLTQLEGTDTVNTEALGVLETRTLHATVQRTGLNQTEKYVFIVEDAAPHRLIQLARDDGYTLTLAGVSREPYWQQNGPDGQSVLGNFGLNPKQPRTP